MDDIERHDDGDLGPRLRAYAGARLSPDQRASIRMRAAVIEHGRAMPAYAAERSAAPATRRWTFLRRPALAIALVGLLVLGSASAAFATSPGGPLYGIRLWLEAATLPAAADARLDAQVHQADTRVDEAVGAVGQGNGAAVSAALNAYRDEVAALLAAAGDDPLSLARLRAELGRHLAALQALSSPNLQADDAIQAAIDESRKALDKIAAKTRDHGRPSNRPGKP